jgi:hypothetical protein
VAAPLDEGDKGVEDFGSERYRLAVEKEKALGRVQPERAEGV